MSSAQEDSGWDLLHSGTGREHLDDPARLPSRPAPGGVTFRFAVGSAGPSPATAPQTAPRSTPASTPANTPGKPSSPAQPKPQRSMVRPYTRTGGRTRSDLALEALVSTSDRGREARAAGTPEYRQICALCVETRSVAEVAALLRIPLGVGKILVEDLAEAGLVFVHKPGFVVDDRSSMDFLERVLNGIRAL